MSDGTRKPTKRAARAALQKLEDLQRAGLTHVPKSRRRAAEIPVSPPPPDATTPRVESSSAGMATGPAVPPDAALDEVRKRVSQCTRCAELARTRTQTVFGDGDPHATLVFIGEAPGADEDRQGKPFVGAAGQKLTEIIVKGMGLRREDVYILNTLKCRPPQNRPPLPPEIANCREYLDQQLAILKPPFICCLGAVASQALLASTLSIGQLRGRVHEYQGSKVVATYHPSYLLRYPPARVQVWEDIQLLMKEMGLPLPGRKTQ